MIISWEEIEKSCRDGKYIVLIYNDRRSTYGINDYILYNSEGKMMRINYNRDCNIFISNRGAVRAGVDPTTGCYFYLTVNNRKQAEETILTFWDKLKLVEKLQQ